MNEYQRSVKHAEKAIKELEQLISLKKDFKGKKLAEKIREAGLSSFITKSAVDSVLIGLGESNNFSKLTPEQKKIAEKLQSLKDEALTHKSPGIQGILEKNMNELTKKDWEESMSTGFGDKNHPINNTVKDHVGQ